MHSLCEINLYNNLISLDGFSTLLSWLVSLSAEELSRGRNRSLPVLKINMRSNQVRDNFFRLISVYLTLYLFFDQIKGLNLSLIQDILKVNPSIVYADFREKHDRTLMIYGKSHTPEVLQVPLQDKNVSLIVAIDLNDQYRPKPNARKRISFHPPLAQQVYGTLFPSEEKAYRDTHAIYPRDEIMRDQFIDFKF